MLLKPFQNGRICGFLVLAQKFQVALKLGKQFDVEVNEAGEHVQAILCVQTLDEQVCRDSDGSAGYTLRFFSKLLIHDLKDFSYSDQVFILIV